jgi:anti-sigma B factor antagonist
MSLEIEKKIAENTIVTLNGRLDTTTAPELESFLDELFPSTKELVFDFKNLEYISSAGLRVILKAQKTMNQKGSMKLINVSSDVMEIFDITGFADFLTIES